MTVEPQVVQLPEGVTVEDAASSIGLCTRLGLIEDTGRGWLLLPHGVTLYTYSPGQIDLAAEPPLTDEERRLFEEDPLSWPE